MSELDDLYQRAKDMDPEKLEKDQPLLARAIREAQPNRDLEEHCIELERRLNREERLRTAAVQSLVNERDVQAKHAGTLDAELNRERAQAQRTQRELKGKIRELEHKLLPPQVPQYQTHELDQLLDMGWHKGA